MRTLLSKWYTAKLNSLMPTDPEAAIYRLLLVQHEVKRIEYKENKDDGR
jgi:hypothetical protein